MRTLKKGSILIYPNMGMAIKQLHVLLDRLADWLVSWLPGCLSACLAG